MSKYTELIEQINAWRDRKITGKTALSRRHIERITHEVTETAASLAGRADEMLSGFGVASPTDEQKERALRLVLGNEGIDVDEPVPGLNTESNDVTDGDVARADDAAGAGEAGVDRGSLATPGEVAGCEPIGPGENGAAAPARSRRSRNSSRRP